MKKILFVITKSNWGGAQRYVYNLATALPREELDIVVALGGTGERGAPPGELTRRLAAADIRTIFIPSFARDMFLVGDARAFATLLKLLRRERPDVVHLNSSKAGGLGALAARLAGVGTIIFTSHGLPWDEHRAAWQRAAIYLSSWMTFLLCHRVIVISRDNEARARRLPFCRRKITFIRSALPPLQFETRQRARVSLALKAGLDDGDTFWIGTIAELTQNKGLSCLVEAAALLAAQGDLFHLFIIGGGEEERALRTQIEDASLQERIHLLGFVADGYRYDKGFDLFVLPSLKEGLPTVLLEAGAAGIPAAASRISGVLDIIQEGESGMLFDAEDPKDLARAMHAMMADRELREKLALCLHERLEREFSFTHMIEKTRALYTA